MSELSREDMLKQALKYRAVLTGYAYAILRDWGLAEDAYQEALITLSAKWTDFDPNRDLYPWIKGIVRYSALDIVRSRKREVALAESSLQAVIEKQFDLYLSEERAEALMLRRDALVKCMMRLRKKCRDVLVGFYRDAMCCEALADAHGVRPGAIRATLSRSRVILRKCMGRELQMEGF